MEGEGSVSDEKAPRYLWTPETRLGTVRELEILRGHSVGNSLDFY